MMDNLRVLLVSPLPPPTGGIATWTVRYLNWMKNNNYQVELVNIALRGKRSENSASTKNIFVEFARAVRIVINIKKKIKLFKPSIVHINTSCSKLGIVRDYLCAKISKKHKTKVIIHYRCNIEDQIGESRIGNYYLKKISKISNSNFVLNKSSESYLARTKCRNIKIVPNFVDNYFITDEEKKIKNNISQICFTGHIKKSKGILEILKAAQDFPNINFLIAGPNFETHLDLETPSNIYYLGILGKEQIKETLYKSDVFLFPSYTEGFSNSLLEAMAMGLPIITTKVGANFEMLENTGGIILELMNLKSLSNYIIDIDDPLVRKKMSNWNINKVKDKYTIDIVMSNIIKEYNNQL
jgi:glycosyltransferase involved in cell wall biosynthesis